MDIINKDYKEIPEKNYEEIIEETSFTNASMADIERLTENIIAGLPKLDKYAIRKEIEQMVVNVSESPTTFDINQGLALSQAYRDRLTEIYLKITKEVKIRKRCIEMLFDANNFISKASSADKRKGEASLKYPMQLFQYENASAFMIEIEQVLNNMKTVFETISRQGSMLSLQVQLGEYKKKNTTSLFDEINDENGAEERETVKELSW
jgi:hypothetical protein